MFLFEAKRLSDTALDTVALGGRRRMPARYQHAEPGRTFSPSLDEESVTGNTAPRALSQQPLEVGLAPQAAPGIQPEALWRRGYNPSRRRPLARRLRSTLRPPGVRLRTRNPWRRARRVFEG